MSRISLEVATASSAVACAVWPSCHRNSALRGEGEREGEGKEKATEGRKGEGEGG